MSGLYYTVLFMNYVFHLSLLVMYKYTYMLGVYDQPKTALITIITRLYSTAITTFFFKMRML